MPGPDNDGIPGHQPVSREVRAKPPCRIGLAAASRPHRKYRAKSECIATRIAIVESVYRKLTPKQKRLVARHLARCTHCHSEFMTMRSEMLMLTKPRETVTVHIA
jgi:hypothetical protein